MLIRYYVVSDFYIWILVLQGLEETFFPEKKAMPHNYLIVLLAESHVHKSKYKNYQPPFTVFDNKKRVKFYAYWKANVCSQYRDFVDMHNKRSLYPVLI